MCGVLFLLVNFNFYRNLVLYPKFSMDGKDYLGIFLCLNEVPSHLADCQYNVIHQLSFLNQRTGDNYVATGFYFHCFLVLLYFSQTLQNICIDLDGLSYFLTVDCEFRLGDCYGNTIISLRDFQDEKNGYLVNDKCVFGVNISKALPIYTISEIITASGARVTQSTTLTTKLYYNFLWTIECFSIFSNSTDVHKSGKFSVLNCKWYV